MSRGLGDVYKRQPRPCAQGLFKARGARAGSAGCTFHQGHGPALRPYPAAGAMAGTTLRVAGRQLSQHSGAGARVLLRQVRAGGTQRGIPGPGRPQGPKTCVLYIRRDLGAPGLGAGLLSSSQKRAGDLPESGDSSVLMKLLGPQTSDPRGRKRLAFLLLALRTGVEPRPGLPGPQ